MALALSDNEEPVFGTIALPARPERPMTRGTAHLDGQPVAVADTTTLRESFVSVGDVATQPDRPEKNPRRLTMVGSLMACVGRVRMLGLPATDLARLAADDSTSW